jgi:hypothetical protein
LINEVFGHIEVAHFGDAVMEENVGRFNVAVDDVSLVQFGQSLKHVIGNAPNILFRNSALNGLCLLYFALKVTIIGELHDDAQHF